MLVTLDWTHAQTSLNRSQAVLDHDGVDADGVLRVVVSTTDPGVANWMDTTGYRTGVVQCREIGSVEVPELTARVVPLASLRDHLPPDTAFVSPEERGRRAAQPADRVPAAVALVTPGSTPSPSNVIWSTSRRSSTRR